MNETRAVYMTAADPAGPDPTCRFSSFCERELWECNVCPDHSDRIDDRDQATAAEIRMDMATKPDPTCIHASECEAKGLDKGVLVAYGCDGCAEYQTATKPEPFTPAEPLSDTARQLYMQSLGIRELRDRANNLLTQLAAKRAAVVGTEQRIRELAQAEDMADARLILSEEFAQLKNETARKAWLIIQRGDDPAYAIAIAARKRAQQELEGHRVAFEVLSEDLRVALAEMRLVSSQLAFMAGER